MLELGRLEDLPQAYRDQLQALNLVPLWPSLRSVLPPDLPTRHTRPIHWSYQALRPLLMQAGELTPIEKAERRVLVLANPGHGLEKMQASAAMYLGMQLLLPGEWAPCRCPPERRPTVPVTTRPSTGTECAMVALWWSASGNRAAPAQTAAPASTPTGSRGNAPNVTTGMVLVIAIHAAAPLVACVTPIMRVVLLGRPVLGRTGRRTVCRGRPTSPRRRADPPERDLSRRSREP